MVIYGEEDQIDNSLPTTYVDMSGNIQLTSTLHHHIGENMVESAMVGASHWEAGGKMEELPGAKPTFFFAPAHISTRDKEWGPGATMMKGMEHSIKLAVELKDLMTVEWIKNPEDLQQIWLDLLDNKVSANRGLMVSLLSE